MPRSIATILILALTIWLGACGTGSGSSSSTSASSSLSTPVSITQSGALVVNQSAMSLRLTDAPIDGLVSVVIQFTGARLKLKSGDWVQFDLATPVSINLLKLQGAVTADLLLNVPLGAGDYSEIRLFTGNGSMANFVEETAGGVKPLNIPGSGGNGILIQKDFTIIENQTSNLVIDFDLRQSVVSPGASGNYQFRPVLNLLSASSTGNVSGMVDPALLTSASCSDPLVDTFNAAYVFSGHNVKPDDINQLASNTEPYATTAISYDVGSGKYAYTAAFLPAGNYTIAFTCNSNLEDLEADDNLLFFGARNITVRVNNTLFL